MEMLSNAVLSDLVSRSIAFLLTCKCEKQEDLLQRLRQLLLRSGTIVEEAERRHVTNLAMLRQLMALRDETFRGYYVLDAARCQEAAAPRESDGRREEDDEEASRHALSRFNPAKRVRVPSWNNQETRTRAAFRARELRQAVRSLEAAIGDMEEFVVFLMSYPPIHRQPYSAHLFLDKCMFDRHMERERVMEFLLQTAAAAAAAGAARPGVLPIVGPAHIGKSTLVEHVCDDERVRNHETVSSFRDKCVIKHRNGKALVEKLLIVVELLEDVDEETWNRLLRSSQRNMLLVGSRMIVTSRSEKIHRLKCLPSEAYWHYFKLTLFGGDDPGQHPKLASLALEMANLMQGSFMFANIGAVVLRDNFNSQSWSRALARTRDYMQKNASLFGEYPDDIRPTKDNHRITWSIIQKKPTKYCMLYDIYERGYQEEGPEMIPFSDMLAGCSQPRGIYEILFWKSRIPPYLSYVCKCEVRDM
ncbi:hypothetical protein U9M48_006563 [Paspalum notatum var. saurae]|uniref:NB-ARC domain-containing protein n=1 Tax=Paspalum notatum var. saurae TaxID=547442 RepID=A0AAQ3PSH5_PASNO